MFSRNAKFEMNLATELQNKDSVTRLCVVPARGGSKRIPRKNMIDVCGRPLISYILEASTSSSLFKKIIVSSDDDEILEYASSNFAVETRLRSSNLASDDAKIYSVVQHEYLIELENGAIFEEIWLLSATACLLEPSDLKNIAESFAQEVITKSDLAMLAVTTFETHPQQALILLENGTLQAQNHDAFTSASQSLSPVYRDSGCAAVFSGYALDQHPNGIPNSFFRPYILPRSKAVDINTFEDLSIAQALLAQKS